MPATEEGSHHPLPNGRVPRWSVDASGTLRDGELDMGVADGPVLRARHAHAAAQQLKGQMGGKSNKVKNFPLNRSDCSRFQM